MAVTLRDYQVDAVARIREAFRTARRVLFVLPTGGGKSITFAYILDAAVQKGRRVLILVHRIELIDQLAMLMDQFGLRYGIIAPGSRGDDFAPVQIASVATLAQPARLARWAGAFNLVIVDEAHHSTAATWSKILASQTAAILGVTATPERLDGRGLNEWFDTLVEGPQAAALIEAGWLSRFICLEPAGPPDLSKAKIRSGDYRIEDQREAMGGVVIQSAVDEYVKRCRGVAAVAFCVDIAHSTEVAEAFRAAGVKAEHVDGETASDERRAAIGGLATGAVEVVCNCGLISEGVDIPAIGVAILLRPTASLSVHLQQIGRSLRPAPGKEKTIIMDFAGNIRRHGRPDAHREWSLEAKKRQVDDRGEFFRYCHVCRAMNAPQARVCESCGAVLGPTPQERAEIQMRLEEARERDLIGQICSMSIRRRIEWAGGDEAKLHLVARMSGFKPGWVFYRRMELGLAKPIPRRHGGRRRW